MPPGAERKRQASGCLRPGLRGLQPHLAPLPNANSWFMYFTDKRHETTGKPKGPSIEVQDWRMRDRLKTVSAALAVCLNIGVEPPDQLRTNPGARLEAWHDPTSPPQGKGLENIGRSLQAQYETLAIRTRYKQYLDPSVEETKKFCVSLRRNAKDERVLFHYNGHGVPKPTSSGEFWVFNKNYTQYIPVSLYDLQHWLGAPTIFVWDCSDAGNILKNHHRLAQKHEKEEEEQAKRDASYEKVPYSPYIHLAACDERENLPTNPLLPADLFTSCLTTPIEMALWYYVLQSPLKMKITPERARKLPGRLQERRTPLGELNWIFTAIADTIAWTTFPRHLFRKFFRQDLMVAALFRNFLLAQRVMQTYKCHPQSFPKLPDTHDHELWKSWDLAVDMALAQLPMLEEKEREGTNYEYKASTFFAEQLTAFEIYLTRGDALSKKPPDQLPVLLQVLLSQQHRVRALILLGRFLDLGPWAVQLALSIGIFPYVLKLLQSAAQELKPIMVFIWTRVLAVDISCQQDLIKDSGYKYFASILKPHETIPILNVDEHKAMCAFILTMLCKGYKPGQIVCNPTEIMQYCLRLMHNKGNDLLRQWSCLCISQLWQDLAEAKWKGIREGAHVKLAGLIKDPAAEVRAAMVHAMTTFLGIPEVTNQVARIEESIAWTMLDLANDGSPLVRKEFLVFLSHFFLRYENKLIVAAYEHLAEEKEYLLFPPAANGQDRPRGLHYARPGNRERNGALKSASMGVAHDSVFAACWKHAAIMSVDPHPEVQRDATIIVDYVHHALLHTFLEWSIEYFREPQLKPAEAEEPGSREYNARLWRRFRNETIFRETQPQKAHAGVHRWNKQVAIINNGAQPAHLAFHQFERHLAVADNANTVHVWDWKQNERKSRFSNGNPEGSKICDIKFINEDDQALLMTGASDGVIRIYRNYDSDKEVELASAWRALTQMVPSNVNAGMVLDWEQVNGQLLVAGDEKVIRVWNAGHEMCSREINARSGSCVTSLTSDQMTGNMFVAGFGDGAVRVFDPRVKEPMQRAWKPEDRQWVRNVHMQRGGQRELVSASRNGIVRLWDIRMDQPLKTLRTMKDVLRTATAHEHLPVFAVGSSSHFVKVFNFDGTELGHIEPSSSSSSFLPNRGTPISATSFHPHRMLLGCASKGEAHINLIACGPDKARA
ncbi:hypothetical protein P8C59_009438 [Phyllachora maydis]|uniref:Raptor N-terminal CASPase-like domain-containing protein n=1 Tax=Phyllachora maydis TaxID=1825666 RepID=A0AAD9ML93_9PEZI|nr:hypothetical protein P8C59_009438 [Phyllachora maydis]